MMQALMLFVANGVVSGIVALGVRPDGSKTFTGFAVNLALGMPSSRLAAPRYCSPWWSRSPIFVPARPNAVGGKLFGAFSLTKVAEKEEEAVSLFLKEPQRWNTVDPDYKETYFPDGA